MAIPDKILAMIKAKKAILKGGKIVASDDDGEDNEDENDDDTKTKRMRDRLKKLKGKGGLKLPTGSMTESDVKPKSVKDSY
jgi:hypothetical protein